VLERGRAMDVGVEFEPCTMVRRSRTIKLAGELILIEQ
jgi:hypothetical protein